MKGTYTVSVEGMVIDGGSIPRTLSITHGRSGIGSQPDAPSCAFTWEGPEPPGAIGDAVIVTASLVDEQGGAQWIYDAPDNYTYDSPDFVWDNAWDIDIGERFAGRINSLKANEQNGIVVSWEVQCLGVQTVWARQEVVLDRPAETDSARVAAIAAAVGMPITILGDPSLTLAADSIDTDCISAIHTICESSGGLLWQDKAGQMHYGTSNHRAGQPEYVIGASSIIDGLLWTSDVDEIVNHVTVKWGPESAQESSTHQDDQSVAMPWGKRHADVSTIAAAQADAEQLGLLIIARRAWPYYIMDSLMFGGKDIARPDALVLARVDIGTSVLLPAPTAPGPTPALWTAWVIEGWTEEAQEAEVSIQLAVSDAARWSYTVLRTWEEAAMQTWAQEASSTWLEALIREPA